MTLPADAMAMTLLVVLGIILIAIIAYMLADKAKSRRNANTMAAIRATLLDYFRRSGVTVSADCVLTQDGCYTALIESEPMKRFRLSHIIEMTLREHVYKACGVELDKIFWRFPVKEAGQVAAATPAAGTSAAAPAIKPEEEAHKAPEATDEYINEGLEHYRHIPQPEVTELPWETFEEVSTGGRKKDSSPS